MGKVGPTVEDKVKLRADTDDLDDLPHFEESHYISTETTGQSTNQLSPGIGSIYWYPPVASRWASDNPYNGGGRQTTFIKETSRNIPEGTIALKEGASVIGCDEQLIGKIEGIITSSPEEKVSHLLVTQGLIWTEKKLVPVTWLSNVDDETVTLSVSFECVKNLPGYRI